MPEGIERQKKKPDEVSDDILRKTEKTQQSFRDGKVLIDFFDAGGIIIHSVAYSPENYLAYIKNLASQKTEESEEAQHAVTEDTAVEAAPEQKVVEAPPVSSEPSAAPQEITRKKISLDDEDVEENLTSGSNNKGRFEEPKKPSLEWEQSKRTEGFAGNPFKMERPFQDAPNDYDWSIPPFIKREFPDPIAAPETAAFNRPPDLKEIVNDPQTRELFSIFIEFHGGKVGNELMKRIIKNGGNDLSASDSDALNRFLKEYQDRENLCSEVREKLTDGDMTNILHSEEVFKPILVSLNEERVKELIRGHFDKMFMRMSWSQINRIVKAQRVNDRIRQSSYFQNMPDHIKKAAGAPPESGEVHEGGWRKLFRFDWLDREHKTLEAIEKNRDRVAKVLAATVSADAQLRRNIADEVLLGHPVPEYGSGDFSSREEVEKESRKGEDTMALRRRIREESFQETVGKSFGRAWKELSTEEREAGSYRQLQLEGRLPALNNKSGFFNIWLSALLDEIFPKMQRELANEFEDKKES